MTENKPKLRITAGVILLIFAALSFLSGLFTRLTGNTSAAEWLNANTVLSLLNGAAMICVAILILQKRFKAAGIVQWISAAFYAAIGCLALFGLQPDLLKYYRETILLLACGYLLFTAVDVVLGIGLFRQQKHEKHFFLIGWILWLAAMAILIFSIFWRIQITAVGAVIPIALAAIVLFALPVGVIPSLAWLFMARWNDAQKIADEPAPCDEPICEP